MIEEPMDVLTLFPIRKTRKQKQAFRDAAQSYAQSLGYTVTVEKGSCGAQNLVIGDPKTARYLVTAHYDTPAALPFPNLITPCNPLTFILYQILIVLLFLAASVIPGVALGATLDNSEVGSLVSMICYWGFLILMLIGPGNRHNANDNTSGVVTVLETMKHMPEELRGNVCFVLFDLEEAGLIGSGSYAKAHKQEIKNQFILNCDCCSDGDEMMMFPTAKVKKDTAQMDALRAVCGGFDAKSLALRERGFAYYPSDQKHFPYGVGIAAFRRSRWAGLYLGRIHTKKDTVLNEENVSFLRDRLIQFIGSAAQ